MSYDLRVKENTLHISEELIEKYTAESMQVTVEMINKGKELYMLTCMLPAQVF